MARFLEWWVRCMTRQPVIVVVVALMVCCGSLVYTVNNLELNTDSTTLFSGDLEFHQNRIRDWHEFPHDIRSILIVVDGSMPEQVTTAVNQLADQISQPGVPIKMLYTPGAEPFFKKEALLYTTLDELDTLVSRLSLAQPFISRLAVDNQLDTLLTLLNSATRHAADTSGQMELLYTPLGKAMDAIISDSDYQLSWQALFSHHTQQSSRLGVTLRFLLVRPELDYSVMMPAGPTMDALQSIIDDVQQRNPAVKINMTGEIPLEHDEMKQLSQTTQVAGLISFLLVCSCLAIGLRSMRLMFTALTILIMGLILTGGFAALVVGHLNMISIAFAVLYIGLGIDYAIHFALHYSIAATTSSTVEALVETAKEVGPSIFLCALTSSVGFYSFVPTEFVAVSELGIISGSSMFIGLLLTLTVMPAILVLLPLPPNRGRVKGFSLPPAIYNFPLRYAKVIRWCALMLGIAALVSLPKLTFDFNPINLRDQGSESVKLFQQLMKSQEASPMFLTVLVDNEDQLVALANRLEQLPEVKKAQTINDFVPQQQAQKLALIDELSIVLGPSIYPFGTVQLNRDPQAALIALEQSLAAQQRSGTESRGQSTLRAQLKQFLEWLDSVSVERRSDALEQLNKAMLATLPSAVEQLHTALSAEVVTKKDLPAGLTRRWLSDQQVYRIKLVPQQDLNQIENLRAFITAVQALAPNAVGLPVTFLESSKTVVEAFKEALTYALIAITLVLLLVLRDITDTLLVLLPLLLAAAMTGAATLWLNVPINFANIIAVPLLLGLGVDCGIHMIHRLRYHAANPGNVLQSVTTRGILFSALTTIFSFTSLAFTAHVGVATLGQLLAIGILFTLISALVILPAFSRHGKPGLI